MKRTLVFLLLSVSLGANAQSNSIDCRLASSFVNQNMKEWNVYVDELSCEYDATKSIDTRFKRMIVRHLYLAYLLFNAPESKQIDVQLEELKSDIDALKKSQKYAKTSLAFEAPYLAYAALNNPVTAMYRLPLSFSAAKTAIKEDPESPYSWAEYGNLQYCYALFVGGDFADAISSLQKAISLFEAKGQNTKCNWYYINTLLFLAKSYEDGKQYDKANQVYDKILLLRPDFEAINRWKHK